ncbi:TMhelix containing protein [Vibrio phage 1.197.A._10N.286.54.F2]|nr:TMhelix containing protein [Vibrio phage 1.197.A._10N.286.54.F2]
MESKKLSRYATMFLLMALVAIFWNFFDYQISTTVTSIGAIVCSTVNHVGSVILKRLEDIYGNQ